MDDALRSVKQFLMAPYPHERNPASALRSGAILGLSVVAFLLAFEPFGIDQFHHPYKRLLLASFGLPTFLAVSSVLLVFQWLLRNKPDEAARLWMQIPIGLSSMVLIAFGNLLLSSVVFGFPLQWASLVFTINYTVAVSFVPWTAAIIIDWIVLVNRHAALARSMNANLTATQDAPPQAATPLAHGAPLDAPPAAQAQAPACSVVVLRGDNRGEQLEVDPSHILYISAEANYVEVHVATTDGRAATHLLRSTLSAVATALEAAAPAILRVHRSFLVNMRRVRHAEGNAQGLTLTLDHPGMEVPVSRSYAKTVRRYLAER